MKTSISITKTNKSREEALIELDNTDAEYVHIDMMDGVFVDNVQLLPSEVLSLASFTNKPLDIHMMVDNPIPYIRELNGLRNIHNITIHEEIGNTINYINCIHELGYKAGVAINPNTGVDRLLQYLDNLDIVLIMGVYPGKGGQELIIETTNKIQELMDLRDRFGLSFEIEFDGGANKDTKKYLTGLDTVVSGSYVCMSDNYQDRIDDMR